MRRASQHTGQLAADRPGRAAGERSARQSRQRVGERSDGGRGDALLSSIEAAYALRFGQFHRVASAIVGDSERGRDAVQEAFVRAISRRCDYRADGPLEAWLWRTVTNVARDHRRQAGSTVLVDEFPDLPDTSAGIDLDRFDRTLRRRIAELPKRQRLALFLRYYLDLSYTEIADVLDIRTGTVSATLNAAHGALRESLPPTHAAGGAARGARHRPLHRPARAGEVSGRRAPPRRERRKSGADQILGATTAVAY